MRSTGSVKIKSFFQIIRMGMVFFVLFVSGAIAADQVVTNNNNSGAGSLRQAIADVGNGETISFNLSSGSETITVSEDGSAAAFNLTDAKSFTIDGENTAGSGTRVTIQVTTPGISAFRVFNINASGQTYTFNNLTIKGGDISGASEHGGVIKSTAGDIVIDNCTLSNSKANNGGALFHQYSSVTINDSNITDNYATGKGGAIYSQPYSGKQLSVTNSTFDGNATATASQYQNYGGAIYATSSGSSDTNKCKITDCTFMNGTSCNGGAIYVNDGGIDILGSTFTGNSATNMGGAVGIGTSGSTENCRLENSTFFQNTGAYGSALIVFDVVYMNNCTVYDNEHQSWGAVATRLSNANLHMRNCLLAGNSTSGGSNMDYYLNGGTVTDHGYNIVQYQSGTNFNSTTDILYNTKADGTTGYATWNQNNSDLANQSLNIATALADNGGNTKTLSLDSGSFAIDAVPYTDSGSGVWNGAPTTDGTYYDQRGEATPADNPISIGAYTEPPPAVAPTVTTTAVSSITTTTASSGGEVTLDGGANVTVRGVCWNTTGTPDTDDDKTTDDNGTGEFTSSLTNLSPGQKYYVRAYATNSAGTGYGDEEEFTTETAAPTVTTTAVSSITSTTASSGGDVTADGGASVIARGVCWNTTGTPDTDDDKTTNDTGTGEFTSSLTNLSPGQKYYVRAYATNSVGTGYGEEEEFTTETAAPTVTTTAVSSITSTTASSGGDVTADGGANVTARGVCWNTTGTPDTNDDKTDNGTGTGEFTSSLNNLSPGQKYYVRAYATNSVDTAYGNEVEFTADPVLPTVTTTAASSITTTTASSGGDVTSDGGGDITARGVCWNTTGTPDTGDDKTTNGAGTGSFAGSLTNLSPGQKYYVRAYATNGAGTAYGNQVSFTTEAGAPTVTTAAVSSITGNTASCGGNVTADGGATVTARGVCWNTTGTPDTGDDKTSDGTGTGSFVGSITGLSTETRYYVRAYATNSKGTAYGNEVDFTTGDDSDGVDTAVENAVPSPGGGTGDGNGDGTPDKDQADVTSLETCDHTDYATLDSTANAGTSLKDVTALSPAQAGVPDVINMPCGVFHFEVHGVTAGEEITMEILVSRDPSITGYFKLNKYTGTWENVAVAVDHTSVPGKTKITFVLKESGPYDNDGDPSTLTDPGGPGAYADAAYSVSQVPTLSQWGMLLMSALLALFAVVRIRKGYSA